MVQISFLILNLIFSCMFCLRILLIFLVTSFFYRLFLTTLSKLTPLTLKILYPLFFLTPLYNASISLCCVFLVTNRKIVCLCFSCHTQKNCIHEIKYSKVPPEYKKILYQFGEIKFLKLLQYLQIDIKLSYSQDNPTTTSFHS